MLHRYPTRSRRNMAEHFYIIASMGTRKERIFIDPSLYLEDLSIKIEELFSVQHNSQKIILKGKLLSQKDASLQSLGVKKGDTLMVLGRVIHTEKDELLEILDKYRKQYIDEETVIVNILMTVGAPSRSTYDQSNLKDSMKQLLCSNEKLMKLLETIDAMEMTVSNDDVRQKRKSIVQNIQKLMDKVDKDYKHLESYVNTPS